MPNQSGKIVLVLVLFLLLIVAAVYFIFPSFKNQEYTEQAPIYSSEPLSNMGKNKYYLNDFKMHIVPPDNFKIEDNFPILVLSNGSEKIDVVRNGTNFDSLQDYIKDFDSKKKVKEISSQEKSINSYPAVEREIIYTNDNNEQKSIYIYVDNFVYIFSTSDEPLYPVLDQIVHSFEYRP